MGFRSGLYGGRNRNQAPIARRAVVAPGDLWLDRLSRSEAPNANGPSERAEHVAFAQCRRQLGFDVEIKHLGVHRPVDDPRGVEAVMAQGRDKGLGAPVAERGMIDQALPTGRPARRLGHVCLDRGLIEESQSFQVVGPLGRFVSQIACRVRHERLTLRDPDTALIGDILAPLLKRLEVFFCV